MNDEADHEQDILPEDADSEDEMRYAPRPVEEAESREEAPQEGDDLIFAQDNAEAMQLAPDLDLDAALAAVSTLDDMLAEQEAAEQAEIARQEAEVAAEEERMARMERPELFFPMPPMLGIQRGRLDSLIPALVLIVVGIWLTFTLTSGAALSAAVLGAALAAALAVALLTRWLASGRWSIGSLFFALLILLSGGVFALLLFNALLAQAWPLLLAGPGLAFILTALLGGERRLILPGAMLIFSGAAGLLLTGDILPQTTVAALWPAALVILLALLILPRFARR